MTADKRITQISVFLENRSGRVASIAETLGQANVDIRAMSLADSSDFGILRLIVNDTEKALAALKDKGFIIKRNEVVAVQVPDEAGALWRTLAVMEEQRLNIEYLYACIQKPGEYAVLIFRFEDPEEAILRLEAAHIRMLDVSDLMK